MINKIVRHVKYGEGKVIGVEEKHLRIIFQDMGQEKMFPYPEAFGRFLVFQDSEMQEKAEIELSAANARKAVLEARKLEEYKKLEVERQLEQKELLRKRRKAAKEKAEKEKKEREKQRERQIGVEAL